MHETGRWITLGFLTPCVHTKPSVRSSLLVQHKLNRFRIDEYMQICPLSYWYPCFYLPGTQNYNGLSVFSISPTEGELAAGKSQDFVVTFSPDHESLYYSDRLKILLFGKVRPSRYLDCETLNMAYSDVCQHGA